MAEHAEICRRHCDAPGSIKIKPVHKPSHHMPGGIENGYIPQPGAVVFIRWARFTMSEGYNNVPSHILYPERGMIGWHQFLDVSAGLQRRRMPAAAGHRET